MKCFASTGTIFFLIVGAVLLSSAASGFMLGFDQLRNTVSDNTTLLQIKKSTPSLIARVNAFVHKVTFTKISRSVRGTRAFPIELYGVRCTDIASARERQVVKQYHTFNFSPNRKSARIDERYTFGPLSKLWFTFYFDSQMENSLNSDQSDCKTKLVTFKDHRDYQQFLANGTSSNSFAEHCIQTGNRRLHVSFTNISYYYTGLFSTSPQTIVGYRIEGSILHYNISSFSHACSILSTESSCTVSLPNLHLPNSGDVCFFASTPDHQESNGTFNFVILNSKYILSDFVIHSYYLIPLTALSLICLLIIITFTVVFCVCYQYQRHRHSREVSVVDLWPV